MRDWNVLVREQLDRDVLSAQEEVVAELASHLEELYEELSAQGLCETEAFERTLDEVADWSGLADRIGRARGLGRAMNDRTTQFWLPALASLTAANLILMAMTRLSLEPRAILTNSNSWFPELSLMASYLPWLAAQPLVGALGAHLSRRAGGSRLARLTASLFPSIVLLGCWVLIIPVSTLLEGHAWVIHHPIYLAAGAFAWVMPAAMGLLWGSLPFLDLQGRGSRAMAERPVLR